MANLATVGSHHVNGVRPCTRTRAHPAVSWTTPPSGLTKFINVTQWRTAQRWIALANPLLRELLDGSIATN